MKFLTMIAICAGLICFELGVLRLAMFAGLHGTADLMIMFGFGALSAWCGFALGTTGAIMGDDG